MDYVIIRVNRAVVLWQTREAARNKECVALGAGRACCRVLELELLAACKMSALYRRRDVQKELIASCPQATLTHR